VNLLSKNGIKYAALTDHDSMDGVEGFLELCQRKKINAIAGAEITCYWEDKEIHMLSYGGVDSKEIENIFKRNSEYRKEWAKEVVKRANKIDLDISYIELLETSQYSKGGIRKPHISSLLLKKNYFRLKELIGREPTLGNVITRLIDGGPLFVEKKKIDSKEVIRVIRNTGGFPVVAHPNLSVGMEQLESFVSQMKKEGLAGLEVPIRDTSAEDRGLLLKLAEDNGLFVTGGSDFHGKENQKPGMPEEINLDVFSEGLKVIFG
jgi:predicted metal-dependent phosphoesterase TrpH